MTIGGLQSIAHILLLASVASPPSDVNGRFSLYIYIYIYVSHTVHTVMPYMLLILRAHTLPLANNATHYFGAIT